MTPVGNPRWHMACLLSLFSFGIPAFSQSVEDVFPIEPEDGAVVGHRPKFRLGVEGSDIMKMRFRIELSRDGFRSVDYNFDQIDDRNGWAFITSGFDEQGALFVIRSPLKGGVYEWKAYAWNGVDWIEGDQVHRLTVDTVPPAAVESLRLSLDRDRERVLLNWQPVLWDQQGNSENVTRYHVYRYHRPSFSAFRTHEIAQVDDIFFEDEDAIEMGLRTVFYRITAEDEAGNQPKWPRRRIAARDP